MSANGSCNNPGETEEVPKVCLPKFATDIIVHISRPISRTLDLKSSAESPGIWL